MGEIVNLNHQREEVARRKAEKHTAENRIRFGRRLEDRLKMHPDTAKVIKNLGDKRLD